MQCKLDKQKQDDICAILSIGGTRAMAAQFVGCHPRTIYATALRLPEFAKRLRRIEVSPEVTFLRTVAESADVRKGNNWRAATWALERMYPARYAKRNPAMLSMEQMRAVLEEVVSNIVAQVPGKKSRLKMRNRIEELTSKIGVPALR